jgi:hypothetical protein
MRPNNRQRSRGGRNGGGGGSGGGSHNHHKQQHTHNPNRPPNRNQIFDSSGPDVRVRGNAHQVFDKYQALAREAAASGDRIAAEAYWQYADHYYRVIQTMGGMLPRNNQGWGDGMGEDGQPQQGNPQQQQGQPNNQQANGGNGYAQDEPQHRQGEPQQHRQGDAQQNRQGDAQQNRQSEPQQHRQGGREQDQGNSNEPGLDGVAFLQSGRPVNQDQDPAGDDQPEVPEFAPAGAGRRG